MALTVGPRALRTSGPLPHFVAGTQNLLAQPHIARTLACTVAPTSAHLRTGRQNDEQPITPGEWHFAADGLGQHYRGFDVSFEPGNGRTFEHVRDLNPACDERARFLHSFWASLGFRAPFVFEARRRVPVRVVGQVAPFEVTRRIEVGGRGWKTLAADDWLLRSPVADDVYWLMPDTLFKCEFQTLTTMSGKIVRRL